MAAEVALRVGDSADPDGYRDGMPIAVWPTGVSWSMAEVNAWVNAGTEPANLTDLPPFKRAEWRRWRRVANYALNSFDEVDAARRWFSLGPTDTPSPRQLSVVNSIRDSILQTQTNVIANGFLDSNWGYEDLRSFAVMSIDISISDLRTYLVGPIDNATTDDFGPREDFARRSVIVDWRSLPGVGPAIIATIEDPAAILAPATFRARLYTRAEAAAVTTVLQDPSDLP